jgi:hypothetical protein
VAVQLEELLSHLRHQHALLEQVATGVESIGNVNGDYVARRDRLVPMLAQVGLDDPFPWRDLWAYWSTEAKPLATYAARRASLRDRLIPAEDFCLVGHSLPQSNAVHDWSEHETAPSSWEHTLKRLQGMKAAFDRAVELDDFQDVARRCREIIIEATDLVHEPWMVPVGAEAPKKGDAKLRLDQICTKLLIGPTYEHVRGVLKKTLSLAQDVTHGNTVTRLEALAAAQSTLMVVLTLRELQRLAQERADVEILEDERRAEEDYADYAAEYWPSEWDKEADDRGLGGAK